MTQLILGLFCLAFGALALRFRTRGLPWAVRYAPVVLAMLGAFMMWQVVAQRTPVVTSAQVNILAVGPRYAVLQVKIEKNRECQFKSMEAFLVDQEDHSHSAYMFFDKDPTPNSNRPVGKNVLEKIIVVPTDDVDAKSVFFQTEHKCAFDIDVVSTFGATVLPKVFNDTPAGVDPLGKKEGGLL